LDTEIFVVDDEQHGFRKEPVLNMWSHDCNQWTVRTSYAYTKFGTQTVHFLF